MLQVAAQNLAGLSWPDFVEFVLLGIHTYITFIIFIIEMKKIVSLTKSRN